MPLPIGPPRRTLFLDEEDEIVWGLGSYTGNQNYTFSSTPSTIPYAPAHLRVNSDDEIFAKPTQAVDLYADFERRALSDHDASSVHERSSSVSSLSAGRVSPGSGSHRTHKRRQQRNAARQRARMVQMATSTDADANAAAQENSGRRQSAPQSDGVAANTTASPKSAAAKERIRSDSLPSSPSTSPREERKTGGQTQKTRTSSPSGLMTTDTTRKGLGERPIVNDLDAECGGCTANTDHQQQQEPALAGTRVYEAAVEYITQ
jgi:hypothetical protein